MSITILFNHPFQFNSNIYCKGEWMCPWHFVCYNYKPVLNIVNKIAYNSIMSYVLMLSWSNRYAKTKLSKHLWCLLESSIEATELYIVTFLTCMRTKILFVAFILTRFSRLHSEELIAKSNIKFLSILFISVVFMIKRKQWIAFNIVTSS